MVKKSQLVSAIVIPALLASNVVMGLQYKKDMNTYENHIKVDNEIIKKLNENVIKQENVIKSDTSNLQSKNKMIDDLNSQLDQVKKENEDLKKQLAVQKEVNSKRKLTIEVSAYTANCRGCSGKTFTGYNVNNTIEYNGLRIIAADPNIIPLYSIVKIDTQNETINAIVIDTGGAIRGNKADLLVGSYNEAIQFGRQKAVITVIREGNGV